MKRQSLGIMAIAALLCGCGSSVQQTNISVLDGQWTIVSIEGAELAESVSAEMMIDMDRTMFSGNAGCNTINGAINVDSTKINGVVFEMQGMTKMLCPDNENESKLISVLEKIEKFSLDTLGQQKVIVFCDNEGTEVLKLQYLRANEVTEWSIKGTWKVRTLMGDLVDKTESTPELFFDLENNMLGGNAGCNNMNGSLELGDYTIEMKDIALTVMECDEHSMEIEAKMVEVLNNVRQWSVENGELILENGDGDEVMTLIRD